MKFYILVLAVFAVVRQLETTPTNTGSAFRANTTDANPRISPSGEKDSNEGEPLPNSRNAIFRHRGITQAKKSRYWNKPFDNKRYAQYTGIQYSPLELAEYVFSTGDEEGVAVAVEELVREGMMGRTDAINYLQDVKQNLEYMKERFDEQKQLEAELQNEAQYPQKLPSIPGELFLSQIEDAESTAMPVVTTEHARQDGVAATAEPKEQTNSARTTQSALHIDKKRNKLTVDYVLQNYEHALGILFQVALESFTESIVKDNHDAEVNFSRLMDFLENEVGNGNISNGVKQLSLSVVCSALQESLRKLQDMKPQNFDGPKLYDQCNLKSPI